MDSVKSVLVLAVLVNIFLTHLTIMMVSSCMVRRSKFLYIYVV